MRCHARLCRLPVLGLCLMLSGCGLRAHWQSLREVVGQAQARLEALHQAEARQQDADLLRTAREAAQDVDKPWLAGPAQPLAREVALPRPLQAKVDTTLIFAGRASLPQLAERLQRATGIAVRVQPEALLPPGLFLPKASAEQAIVVPAAAAVELQEGPRPLADILDSLAARLLVWWRYRDGAIEFYRSDTRVFDLRMLPLQSQAEARLGRSADGGAGFDHAIRASASLQLPAPAVLLGHQVEAFLTRFGKVSLTESGTSLIVTDTPAALARVAAYIAQENTRAGRRVRLLFEELTLRLRDSTEGAIDWRLLYASARAGVEALLPPGAPAAGAALGVNVAQGAASGSRAILRALAEYGAVRHHRSIPLLTLNRRPVSYAVHSTFSYVDQIERSPAGESPRSPSAVSVNQRRVTVGTFLTLLPDAQDDGSILLSIGYDNTVAQPLRALAFGDGQRPLQVQQLTLDGSGSVQQVRLRPGQAVVLSGFDRSTDSVERQRVAPQAPLLAGGRDQASHERLLTVIVISAQLEEADG